MYRCNFSNATLTPWVSRCLVVAGKRILAASCNLRSLLPNMACFKSKKPQLINKLQVPPEIDLSTAENIIAAFNNDFMKRFQHHLELQKDVLSGNKDYGKGCVTRTTFKEILKQSYSDLRTQCTPASTARCDSLCACHSSNLQKLPPTP